MASSKWQVAWYIDEKDRRPVLEYIFQINEETAIGNIINVIQMLATVGVENLINTKMCDEIESPIYELRKDRHRILFGRDKDLFILLSAFLKQTQKTPPSEINLACNRWHSYLKNKKFEVFKINR